ncbi:InlB B-repeat-containing protein [Enterococcus cecorum]|nr:InlB B-repeat-containing protein [Enterococcus cecorum]
MADFYTSKWGNNYSPQVRLSVGVANLNGGTARVTWILDYVTSGYAAYTNGVARSWSIAIDGQVRSGTFNINGVSSTTRISSGTIDVARGTSARNIAVSASFNFDVSWAGSYSGSRTASGSVGVERKVSYTVSFNANGGSGAPGAQSRWYGEVITLSSTRPTRYGYIFQGWAKSSSGAVEYQPGSKYGLDANTTLYAIWKAETYTISFNANGGSGAPGNQTKTYGQTLTLSSTKPNRTNYNFLGWATSSGSSTAEYQAGGSYTNNAAVTLYAVWQLAYTPPRVTNVRSDRCNSAGTLTEEGTYVKVTFNWATDYNISAIYIRHKASSSSTWTTTTVSATGRVGSVTQVIGSNGISTEYTYNIQIEVRDSVGSSTVNQDVPAMSYVIDFKTGGKGVAIGKPATTDNLFEVNFPTRFTGGVDYIYIPSGQDLNNYKTPGFYYNPANAEVANISNTPVNDAFTLEVSKHAGVSQTFTRYLYNKPRTWIRNYFNGTWGSWFEVFFANDFNSNFDTRLANTAATFKGEIGLPYGLKCRAYKIGRIITLNMSRQIVTWNSVVENGACKEVLPTWAKPMSETTYVLTRNAGTTYYNPTILHLRSDGSIAATCSNGGTFVHTGTVTYMCSNAD